MIRQRSVPHHAVGSVLTVAALLSSAAVCALDEGPTLTVLDTVPQSDGTVLSSREPFYVRYRIESARPVSVSLDAYSSHTRIPAANSGEHRLQAGSATAVGFVFLFPQALTHVDEIRFTVRALDDPKHLESFSLPVDLQWQPVRFETKRATPDWLAEYREAELQPSRPPDVKWSEIGTSRLLLSSTIYFGPMLAVPAAAVAMAKARRRRGEDREGLVSGALWMTVRWGLYFLLVLIAGVVALTAATRSGQAPLWLLFAPWVIAAGEIAGLLRWRRESARGG